jgi:hypothetical protein
MARWQIVGDPFRYEGGDDPSADVEFGYRFDLRNDEGRTATVNVEHARGTQRPMSEAEARNAVSRRLDREEVPLRIVWTTDEQFVDAG